MPTNDEAGDGPAHLGECLRAIEQLRSDQKLAAAEQALQRLQLQGEVKAAISDATKQLTELFEIVRGRYGSRALVSDMENLRARVQDLEETRSTNNTAWTKLCFAVLGGVVMILMELIKNRIQGGP